jgi:hypothetical protein
MKYLCFLAFVCFCLVGAFSKNSNSRNEPVKGQRYPIRSDNSIAAKVPTGKEAVGTNVKPASKSPSSESKSGDNSDLLNAISLVAGTTGNILKL